MRAVAAATLAALLVGWAPAASAGSGAELSLVLEVTSGAIGPIEPLHFRLTLANEGESPSAPVAPFAVAATTTVELRAADSVGWRPLKVPAFYRFSTKYPAGGLPSLPVAPGEKRAIDLQVLYDPGRSYRFGHIEYYYDRPGDYVLRATYRPASGPPLVSNEAAFRVVAYTGEDAKAYAWLRNRPIPHFVYDFDVYADNSAYYTVDDARHLIEAYPESRFAPLAKLYLARAYRFGLRRSAGATDPPDLERAAELARELVATAPPEVRSQALNLLGQLEPAPPGR